MPAQLAIANARLNLREDAQSVHSVLQTDIPIILNPEETEKLHEKVRALS